MNANTGNEQCQKCVANIVSWEFDANRELYPAIQYILKIDEDNSSKLKILTELDAWICNQTHVGTIRDMLRCDDLLCSILNYKPVNEILLRIIEEILATKYDIIGESMLKNGVLYTLIRALIPEVDSYDELVLDCFELLCTFNIPSKYLDDIRTSKRLVSLVEGSSEEYYPLSHALVKEVTCGPHLIKLGKTPSFDWERMLDLCTVLSKSIERTNLLHQDDEVKNLFDGNLLASPEEMHAKPSIRRRNNVDKFKYHNKKTAKLHKQYKMSTKYKYNRW